MIRRHFCVHNIFVNLRKLVIPHQYKFSFDSIWYKKNYFHVVHIFADIRGTQIT